MRRWLWAPLGILIIGIAYLARFSDEDPDAIAVSATRIGECQTNGEHWIVFRFDAPKSRAVMIQQVLAVGGDRMLSLGKTRAESFPDPSRPIDERIEAGSSKLLKVRRVGGGNWQARFDLIVPLKLGAQLHARIKTSWRQKSFKSWNRNYVERGRPFVESAFVKTAETAAATPSPQAGHSFSFAFPSLPFTTGENEIGKVPAEPGSK